MSDSKFALLEHSSAINTIIQQTFQTTQRIKFTTFDVSSKYIIFGANSGGIYIFQREPCQFLKLIPSTHGATNIMQISPNEENLAIATATGFIIVLESFANSQFEQQVFTEHEAQTVTAMRWNGNDLYCGDSIGRVSVIAVKAFLTKAIFQPPVACLMHLDHQIVQLDTFSKFLLVSTQTRSLLCDIETERFRQIGKKSRDGPYGSCFLNSSVSQTSNLNKSWGLFTTVESDEQFVVFDTDVKIYCARPGLRLWQADFQGNVVLTHQFKSSLPQTPNKIIQWGNWDELKIKFENAEWENFNFQKIYPILDKFILTFSRERFYIFEPASSLLVFWGNLKDIQEIKIVDSFLYVWHNNMEVSVFSLLTVEELVLRSLIKKKYRLCGQLCVEFLEEVERLILFSKKIHILSALENKLEDADILEKLGAVFAKLKELAKNPKLEKVTNGIVTVNALPVLPESVENFQSDEKDKKISILLEQFKVSKIHENIETNEFIKLAESLNAQDFHQLLVRFQRENSESDRWCKEMFLKKSKLENPNSEILQYASTAFFEVNDNLIGKNICECDFPLPKAHQTPPKYCDNGEKLMSHDFENFIKKIPYMYKFALKSLDAKDVQIKISLLIQFSDSELMKIHANKITYDLWDESVKLLSKLKSGQCLNCKLKIDSSASFQWSDFGIFMVNSIKPSNTIKLLKRYSHLIPNGELNEFFYQYCIFSSVTRSAKEFEIVNHEEVKEQLEATVGGFLRKKYLQGDDYQPSPINRLENCDHCHLPLKTPILDKIERLSCGHNYHRFCFTYIQSMCSSCEPVLLMQNKFQN